MAESRTTANATVTMTVVINLASPWGGECTLEQIRKQAREDAEQQLGQLRAELRQRGFHIGTVQEVHISLKEKTR